MKRVTVALTTNSVKTLGKEMGEVQRQFKFSIEFVAGSRHYGGELSRATAQTKVYRTI